jgi:hypothetical protein
MANVAIQYYDPSGNTYEPQYLDLQTGNPIDYADLPYYDVKDQSQVSSGEVKLPEEQQKQYDTIFKSDSSQKGFAPQGSTAQPRNVDNNFGYAHKPGFIGAMGALPGPVGMVGKAASLAMNANNRQAVQDARQVLGLPQKTNLGSFLQDNKGLVANVNISNPKNPDQNETVPVGFEVSDKTGRTMMTPNEARNRSLVNPGSVAEAARQDVKDAQNNFSAQGLTAPKMEQSIGSKMLGNVFGSSYNTAKEDTTDHIATGMGVASSKPKGKGLMDLSPSFKNSIENGTHVNSVDDNTDLSGVNYSHPERGDVTTGLTDRTKEAMGALATNTPGGINVSSAYRSSKVNAAIGGASKSFHQTGQAFDVSTKGMTDDEKRDMTERAIMSGAMEIGTYGDQSLHIATDRRNPINSVEAGQGVNAAGIAAMYNRSEYNMDKAPGWFTQGVTESRLAPTPTARPTDQEINAQNLAASTQTMAGQERFSTPDSFAGQDRFSTPQLQNMAQSKSLDRYNALSDDDRRMMAMTLAGEIDPSKTKIGSEDFTKESYGIAQTMDNRVGKYGTMAGVIGAPNQYSTWNNKAAADTAQKNYNLNPTAYDSAVKGYYSSDENNQGFTNYHANTINPGWGAQMTNSQQIGAHTFGTLAEYQSQPVAQAVSPAPMATPSLTNASSTAGGFSAGPTAAADGSNHFSGPSQTGGQNESNSNSSNNGGNKSDSSTGGQGTGGGFASSAGANGPSTSGGGFANGSSASNKSDNDKNDSSGYGGSRSDGWN